jgi:uncharacterized membrane protein
MDGVNMEQQHDTNDQSSRNPNFTIPHAAEFSGSNKPAYVIYIIYLIAVFTSLPVIVAGIAAYIYRNDNLPAWLNSHYAHQIRMFWWYVFLFIIPWGLLIWALGNSVVSLLDNDSEGVMLWVIISWAGLALMSMYSIAVQVWLGLRTFIGLKNLSEEQGME